MNISIYREVDTISTRVDFRPPPPPHHPSSRFVDGQRVKCRVIQPSSGTTSKSTANSTGDGGSFQPVELSVRQSRLDPARGAEEAARREDAPEVGSTAKVK